MLHSFQPAHPGRTFFPGLVHLPEFFQREQPAASAAAFQVPVNLSSDEIRDMVRELLG